MGAFVIEEQTGSKRRVALKDRAMPYRQPSWGVAQRTKKTYYAGNPVATTQVLGAQDENTTISGMWKDKYILGNVEVVGFAEPQNADDIVKIFDSIARSGNRLRVQWQTFVRNGILVRFTPTPDRIHDIMWQMEFEWFSHEDLEVPRAIPDEQPAITLPQSMNEIDDNLAFEPKNIDPNFSTQALLAVQEIRDNTLDAIDSIRDAEAIASTPGSILGAVGTSVEAIRGKARDEVGRLLNTPATLVSALDFVTEVLKAERWRRTQARRIHDHNGNAMKTERDLMRVAAPGAIGTITVRGPVTLRDLSVQVYGTADSWQEIADYNGITGSIVEAGTVVAIPQPGQQRGVRTDGNIQTERAGTSTASC